jgi:hyperosmotically inducible protein
MKTTKNRSVSHFLALSSLFAVLGLAGCDQQGSAEKTKGKAERTTENTAPTTSGSADRPAQPMQGAQQPSTQKSETIGGTIDDTAITTKVKAALLNDPSLSASRIDVTTEQGIVKLSGTVDSEQGANKARALATAQPGVKSVQSDLSVTTAPGK